MKKFFLAVMAMLLMCSCTYTGEENTDFDTLTAGVFNPDTDTIGQLENSLIATLDAEIVPPEKADLSKYDMLFIDKGSEKFNEFDKDKIQEYVKNGGAVFLDNSFCDSFDKDFIGVSEFKKLDECPSELDYPEEVESGMEKIRELLSDFLTVYKEYKNYDKLSDKDYGMGAVPTTAQSIAEYDGTAIYTLNKYGDGYVFFTNPLLPNLFSVNNFTPDSEGEYLSSTTVSANILLRSLFAEFVSIKKHGYAVWRTLGSFGTKPASWELHYEDITGIENSSLTAFDELCRKYYQFPSYTLARNPYVWFERAESVTYLDGENGKFEPYDYENAYSSGRHFVSMNKWLQIDNYENTESYFQYDGSYIKRAYPCPVDFDRDGKMDLICGSADGRLYFYGGIGGDNNYKLGAPVLLTDADGKSIGVEAYSSPALADIDSDGIDELLSGSENGGIYCFKPVSGCMFENQGKILDTQLTDSMIDAGDINGDGLVDLAVGSRNGEMHIYFGEKSRYGVKFEKYENVETGFGWCSPCISDGKLFAGTGEGYIAEIVKTDNGYKFNRYLECEKKNHNGNNNLKFGENCVPRFYGDKLIAGQLEYGMAYPIDSEYFPYRDKLQEQIDYCEDNYIYMGIHSLTHKHADTKHELNELEMHKKAFESYGLEWKGKGANQHTWYTSHVGYDGNYDNKEGYDGTYAAQNSAGILWNSGSQTPNSSAVPQICAENAIPMPFYISNNMLMMQPSNIPYGDEKYSSLSVKYEAPLLFYHHCDYIYKNSQEQEMRVKAVDKAVTENGYSFVGENQMAKAVAAAYNTRVCAKKDESGITLKAEAKDKKIPLYDKKYADCTGVKVVFAPGTDISVYGTDASVWHAEEDCMYVSLNKPVRIAKEKSDRINITGINIPAEITEEKDKVKIKFKENGFMQVFADKNALTSSGGWETVKTDGKTIFVKYGKADELVIGR